MLTLLQMHSDDPHHATLEKKKIRGALTMVSKGNPLSTTKALV